MGNGYPRVATDDAGEIALIVRRIQDRLGELEAPTGSQLYEALAELRLLVDNLPGQINAALAIEVNTGTVNASGHIIAGGTLWSTYAYNNPVVSSYLAAYINNDGRFGATPSALRLKQDITARTYTLDDVALLQVVNYRLIEAVELHGDDAAFEVGLIGDWMLEAGFPEFVVVNPESGEVITVHYERIALVCVGALQDAKQRIEAIESRLDAAGI